MIRLLLVLLTACGPLVKSKKPTEPVRESVELLGDKSTVYLDLIKSHQDEQGFIMADKCDSLLFSGLLSAAAPQLRINILAARDEQGAWHRRPDHACGPEFGNSRSTISRDMIIGLMWHMWRNRDLAAAQALMEDLQHDNYVLKGDGTPGELLMTTAMIQTLAEMVYKLGGPNYAGERSSPAPFDADQTGFEAHLTVWHILLRGEIYGGLSEANVDLLRRHAEREPKNPFYQAAYHKYLDGDYSSVLELLMYTGEWPAYSLPTSANHCSDWPIQRDYSEKDWGACEPTVEHTGAELPLIYSLIIRGADAAAAK